MTRKKMIVAGVAVAVAVAAIAAVKTSSSIALSLARSTGRPMRFYDTADRRWFTAMPDGSFIPDGAGVL